MLFWQAGTSSAELFSRHFEGFSVSCSSYFLRLKM